MGLQNWQREYRLICSRSISMGKLLAMTTSILGVVSQRTRGRSWSNEPVRLRYQAIMQPFPREIMRWILILFRLVDQKYKTLNTKNNSTPRQGRSSRRSCATENFLMMIAGGLASSYRLFANRIINKHSAINQTGQCTIKKSRLQFHFLFFKAHQKDSGDLSRT